MQLGDQPTTLLAVCGAHLRGQPLNPFLLGLGAGFVRTTRTEARYRMVAVPALPAAPANATAPARPPTPARPGLIRQVCGGGRIEVELYRVPIAALGPLLVTVAPPLVLGTVDLEGGEQVLGFLCEGYAAELHPDITALGGWRDYLADPATAASGAVPLGEGAPQ